MKANLIKRGVAAAVFAGMLAATPCVANAATVTSNTVVTKEWTVASESQYSSSEIFKINIKYNSAEKVGSNDYADLSSVDNTVELTGLNKKDGVDLTYTKSTTLAELLNGVNFSKPGVYYFDLKETAGKNSNISYDKSAYVVKVEVGWNEDLTDTEILSTVVYDNLEHAKSTATTGKASSVTFENGKADNGGEDSLKLEKKVSGHAANTSDDFTFTVKLTGLTGSYDVTKSGSASIKDGNGNEVTTVTGDVVYTVTLSDDESISVAYLPTTASYEIVETDYLNYDSTDIENNGVKIPESSDKKATGSVVVNGAHVTYTNNKGFAADTGITMNTLPFIGVGAVAAAGAVTLVISRKRRAGEDF